MYYFMVQIYCFELKECIEPRRDMKCIENPWVEQQHWINCPEGHVREITSALHVQFLQNDT